MFSYFNTAHKCGGQMDRNATLSTMFATVITSKIIKNDIIQSVQHQPHLLNNSALSWFTSS